MAEELNIWQIAPLNELKSEIFLYYTVELLKSYISFTGC